MRRRVWVSGGIAVVVVAITAVLSTGASGEPAQGKCSRATALQVMTRYQLLYDPTRANPVGSVLCGAFLGPDSEGMAVSSSSGTCLPFNGWSVFRYVDGDWRPIPDGNHGTGFFLGISRSGNDIVETFTIRHRGETMCTASGVRARHWHWDGAKLASGPWKVLKPGHAPAGPNAYYTFFSPSHNILCSIERTYQVFCQSVKPPREAVLDADGSLVRRNGLFMNTSGTFPVLAYGHQHTFLGFRCRSAMNGVTCVVISSGKGFRIAKAGVARVP
jgi:hypothetical protein